MKRVFLQVAALIATSSVACTSSDSGELTQDALRVSLSATDGLTIYRDNIEVLTSLTVSAPASELRAGDSYRPFSISDTVNRSLDEQYGYYVFDDRVSPYESLTVTKVEQESPTALSFELSEGGKGEVRIEGSTVRLRWSRGEAPSDRLAMTFACQEPDRFFGLGAHVSIEHRGYDVPIWVSEQGHGKVDRGETSPIFFVVGDHYSSYTPVPFALTNRPLGLLLETTERSHFELCSHQDALRLEVQGPIFELVVYVGESMADVLQEFTADTGRLEPPARWNLAPVIDAGGGPEEVTRLGELARDEGIPASAIWVEDWVGIQEAFGGKHLHYDWEVDTSMYPDLRALTRDMESLGLRFLAYVSPYIPSDTQAAQAGLEGGYLVVDEAGEPIIIEYPWGAPPYYFDLTTPEAESWFKTFVEQADAQGVDGWMADFGEALPYAGRLGDGRAGKEAHNDYPRRWTGTNLSAWKSLRPDGDFMLFTRSGYTGTAAKTRIHWLGDQMTSFDRNDGFGSVIPLYISAGLSGIPLTHSDVGGYAKAPTHHRTLELWKRWLAFEAFTPVMRTHHSSEPDAVIQWYSTSETRALFKRYAQWHQRLLPYFMMLVEHAAQTGTPTCRPLWWGHEDQTDLYPIDTQLLVGEHLMVAPILEEGSVSRSVTFPSGAWSRWTDFAAPLEDPITSREAIIEAAETESILFVGAGAAVPLLTEDYDSMALPKDGIERPAIKSAPAQITSLGFLLTSGGSTQGSLDNSTFGRTTWQWQADDIQSVSTDDAQVNGTSLSACQASTESSCILDARTIMLTLTPATNHTVTLAGGRVTFTLESDTVTALELRLR